MKFGKKQVGAIVLVLISLALYTGWQQCNTVNSWYYEEGTGEVKEEGIIRLHVIANSNTDEDQALKLAVRDRLIEYINEALVKETMDKFEEDTVAKLPAEDVRAFIVENDREIEQVAEKVLRERGCQDEVEVQLETRWIPERHYGDIVFPAGNYEALDVRIGFARGHNWWCVLYPPLCLIDSSDSFEEESSRDQTGEDAVLYESERIVLKSKTMELLNKRFHESENCDLEKSRLEKRDSEKL